MPPQRRRVQQTAAETVARVHVAAAGIDVRVHKPDRASGQAKEQVQGITSP